MSASKTLFLSLDPDNDGGAGDTFGYAVSISGDTALVGCPKDAVGANYQQGSAYVYVRSGATWRLQAKLVASDGVAYQFFGTAVSVSGDTALIGATRAHRPSLMAHEGSVYVFVRSGATWTEQLRLSPNDNTPNDDFGTSVALSGETALVGAPQLEDAGATPTKPGATYVFARSGAKWTEQTRLVASDGAAGDAFGASVSLNGDTALVGAPQHDFGAQDRGASYVFVRSGATWAEQGKLIASDGADFDSFGASVALDGNDALIGADACANERTDGFCDHQGAAYVFTRSGSTWSQQAKLSATAGTTGNHFGSSVALGAGTAAVGAFETGPIADAERGQVFVYVRSGTSWTTQSMLGGDEIGNGSLYQPHFGRSVGMSGDTLLVGANPTRLAGFAARADALGSAFVLVHSGTTWMPQIKLKPDYGSTGAHFGVSVACSGAAAIVGAPFSSMDTRLGSAKIYERSGSIWSLKQTLTADELSLFGSSVAISGDTALVGSTEDRAKPEARVFVRAGSGWALQAKLPTEQEGRLTLALDGDTALVGSQNTYTRVSVFVRSETVWSLQATLISTASNFGYSLALAGDTALIGDPSVRSARGGTAYVFVRNGSAWTRQAVLSRFDEATDGDTDHFGYAVALEGNRALIGAPQQDKAGRAFIFARFGTAWRREAELSVSDDPAYQSFGSSVALNGDRALVGRPGQELAFGAQTSPGSVHLFERSAPANWVYRKEFSAADGADFDTFGASLAMEGEIAWIGSPLLDGVAPFGNPDEGGVYVVSVAGESNGGAGGAGGAPGNDSGGAAGGSDGADAGAGGTAEGGSSGSHDGAGGNGGATQGGSGGDGAAGEAGRSGTGAAPNRGGSGSGGRSEATGGTLDAGAAGAGGETLPPAEGCSCRTAQRPGLGGSAGLMFALLTLGMVRWRSVRRRALLQ
ncbi:MAG TPA: hypothetical protein VG937_06400 [Polyangiaceae bacterium]|nr:hypothetical protein [Polyangiaceae bacterium]